MHENYLKASIAAASLHVQVISVTRPITNGLPQPVE
jgi:hypothetical protein